MIQLTPSMFSCHVGVTLFTLLSFVTMSLLYTVVGDSNSKRHLNAMNRRIRPSMAEAELKQCGRLEIFSETLRSIRSDTMVVIIACITNFMTATDGDSSSASHRIEPVVTEVKDILESFCQEYPERYWFLSPPMYRTSPVWYLDGLPEIMLKFSELMKMDRPRNLYLLPSFPNVGLEADGIHLNPYSGLQFVVHMFDSAASIIEDLKKPNSVANSSQSESIRCLEDRVHVLEQDHRRLNASVEAKSAVNAEAWDFDANTRYILQLKL